MRHLLAGASNLEDVSRVSPFFDLQLACFSCLHHLLASPSCLCFRFGSMSRGSFSSLIDVGFSIASGLLNRFQWMNELYPVGSKEILIFKASIRFADHLQEFLCAMLSACTFVIPPSRELKDNPSSIVYFLQAYSVNRLIIVPSLMKAIVPSLRNDNELRIQSSLKLLILSGEVFPLPLCSKLLSNTSISILNIYGSTEGVWRLHILIARSCQ